MRISLHGVGVEDNEYCIIIRKNKEPQNYLCGSSISRGGAEWTLIFYKGYDFRLSNYPSDFPDW